MTPIKAFELYTARGADGADEAMAILHGCLNQDPDEIDALILGARIQYDAGHFGLADTMLRRALQNKPDNNSAWLDLGRVQHMMQKSEVAARYFTNALTSSGDRFVAYNNLILMNNTLGHPEKALEMAPVARFLVDSDSDAADLNGNIGIAKLMLRQWKDAWVNYDGLLRANMLRKEMTYTVDGQALPRWDGKPGGEVIVYGEQGLGDEILFSQMIRDMIAAGTTPIIHCDKRLEGLFRRSFDCPVYGGRGKNTEDEWLKNHAPKAAVAIGSLGRWFRTRDEDFPRDAYLKADPEKRAMCRALLNQWPGKKMGLAWTGGSKKTRSFDRSVTLEDMQPLLDMPGVTWVSLQYRGGKPEDERIKHVAFLTQSPDYDDTAALVAELDGVVAVTTTVAHLAGALGKPCHVLVPQAPTWHWCKQGRSPWHPIVSYRRTGKSWTLPILQIKTALEMEMMRG